MRELAQKKAKGYYQYKCFDIILELNIDENLNRKTYWSVIDQETKKEVYQGYDLNDSVRGAEEKIKTLLAL